MLKLKESGLKVKTDGYIEKRMKLYPARKQGADSEVYFKLSFGN